VINGCNDFGGKKLAKIYSFVGGRIIVQKKNLESRTQLGEPAVCVSGGDPLFVIKILNLPFSFWY
jgi:hypothetical protein